MKKIKTVVACVWMMCMSLCVFAAQPSKGQIENINLIPILYSNRLDCLKFNPKYQQVYVIKTFYSDYENGLVEYGDNAYLADGYEYTFSNKVVSSLKSVELYKDGLMKNPFLEFSADKTNLRLIQRNITFPEYIEEEPTVLLYKMENGNIELTDVQNRDALVVTYEIMQKEDCREVYRKWAWYDDGEKDLYYEIKEDGDILELYDGDTYSKYENGILMEKRSDSTTYRYTTANGKGEYQKISKDGTVETLALLKRKTDKDGYLTYQRLEYPNGNTTELFIGKELPDVSGLVNEFYPNIVPEWVKLQPY